MKIKIHDILKVCKLELGDTSLTNERVSTQKQRTF